MEQAFICHQSVERCHLRALLHTHTAAHLKHHRMDSALSLLPQYGAAGVIAAGQVSTAPAPLFHERLRNSRLWPSVAINC